MRENFTISISNGRNLNGIFLILMCLIVSGIIIYPALGLKSVEAILSFILLFIILYVIVSSMTNENLSNELPSTLYPVAPHTGLDGISLNNYVAGMQVNKYI